MATFEDQFINVGPVRTRYWQAGDSGSAIVLLHGIGCSVLEWRSNIAALALKHRVYALDLLGFGLTDKPGDANYSLRGHAQFVLDFMASQGLARAHLVGNSLGGRVALESALMAPARVASMVLADAAGVDRETHITMRLAAAPVVGELFTRPSKFGLRMLWKSAFYNPAFVTDALVEDKFNFASLPGAQAAFLKTLRSFLAFGGFPVDQVAALHAALPSVQVPALVVWGKQDNLLPVKQADVLKRLLPKVEVKLYDRCGHAPMVECAQVFNEDVLRFWAALD
jgi:4,5:9,10-diseco-3-hydroxy-5,9,17-trioxoandrosta-1(10),2-diene-4-oate hydrolase